MHRRSFIALLGGAIALPCVAAAQQRPMPAIGYLSGGSPGPNAGSLTAFRQGLSEGGYIEGRNAVIEYRWAEGSYDRLPAMAADLVGRQVDVIAASNLPAAQAAKRATSTIPIIFLSGGDPVERGLVASLARPGANLTGISILVGELMPKRLELLSEVVPQAGVIALLVNPNNPNTEQYIKDIQEAARAKGVRLHILKAGTESDFAPAFVSLLQQHGAALVVLCDVRTPFEDAARVFAPQKGADADAVRRLTKRLQALARRYQRDPRGVPMTGAAGGPAGLAFRRRCT